MTPIDSFRTDARRALPWLGAAAAALIALGLGYGLLLAPAESWGARAHRALLVHLPAGWLALAVYAAIAALSAGVLRSGSRLAAMLSSALAPTGILFAALALWSGALWQKPLTGAWWTWDARAAGGLLLLFLYGAFVALKSMIEDPRRADRAGALIALVGAANLPVLVFTVHWWEGLHRGSIPGTQIPALGWAAAASLAALTLGFIAYCAFAAVARLGLIAEEREWQCANYRLQENEP